MIGILGTAVVEMASTARYRPQEQSLQRSFFTISILTSQFET